MRDRVATQTSLGKERVRDRVLAQTPVGGSEREGPDTNVAREGQSERQGRYSNSAGDGARHRLATQMAKGRESVSNSGTREGACEERDERVKQATGPPHKTPQGRNE